MVEVVDGVEKVDVRDPFDAFDASNAFGTCPFGANCANHAAISGGTRGNVVFAVVWFIAVVVFLSKSSRVTTQTICALHALCQNILQMHDIPFYILFTDDMIAYVQGVYHCTRNAVHHLHNFM